MSDNSAIIKHLNGILGKHKASKIIYDNTTSGLTAAEVQSAIDELGGGEIIIKLLDGGDATTVFELLEAGDATGSFPGMNIITFCCSPMDGGDATTY